MADAANVGLATSQVNQNPPCLDFPHLPSVGWFPVSSLARLVGKDPKTLKNWILRHNCPYKQPGDEMWVDVQDVWKSWPYHKPSETPRPQRGRKKRQEE